MADPNGELKTGENGDEQQQQPIGEFAMAARRLSISRDAVNVWLLMENAVEKLKLLNYEKDFCEQKGIEPFTRIYFAQQASNASTQFTHFVSLVSWLMSAAGSDFSVDKYDDPNTCTNKLMLCLRTLKFELDFPASKVRQGYGEAVCSVINFLADKALKLKHFEWRAPEHDSTDAVEEAEVDAEADLGMEVEDEAIESDEEEALFCEQKLDESKADAETVHVREIIERDTNPELLAMWRTELERVSQRLKVNLSTVGNEWRSHLQQTRQHEQTIRKQLPSTGKQLTQMGESLSQILTQISTKEGSLNNQFESISMEHSKIHKQLKDASGRFESYGGDVSRLTNELETITAQLSEIKEVMDTRGNSMTDTTPLQKIRKALSKIKAEIKEMDLRMGVVDHSLTQAKLRNKSSSDTENNPEDDAVSDDEGYEF